MTDTAHSPLPQRAIVTLSDSDVGEGADGNSAALRWRLRGLVMEGASLVIVDVSDLDQISSTLLAALLDTHRVCRRRGGGVVIRHASRKMTDVLRRTGLDRVFDVEAA
ncbi:MAG TPA: STAS domain-containing protein [Kribbella sp.]|nr:STAS domain-containing protein [Kribbella sp.]